VKEKTELRVSVRLLIEFCFRSGDLDLETYTSSRRAQQGLRAHQKLQKSRPDNYRKEVTLNYKLETEDFLLAIRGRMDGLYITDKEVIIEEIKTTSHPLEKISPQALLLWWGQAKIYAAIYCRQNELRDITVQLAIYQLDTKEETKLKEHYNITELDEFFKDVLDKFYEWAKLKSIWQTKRDISLRKMEFPYPKYRLGQRELAVEIYHNIKNDGQIIVQAPTGIGKTLATLFAALKAIGTGFTDRIFYLTARTTGKTIAAETAQNLADNGLDCRFLVLTSKERVCFNPQSACHPDECEFAKGFYDRLNDAVRDIFFVKVCDRNIIEEFSRKHSICPFEFSLEIALYSDCIICDYNYAFDPRVYLRRFFEASNENYTFLVDEAHNLVDRSRGMYSAELQKSQILKIRRRLKGRQPEIYSLLGKLNQIFLHYKKEMLLDEEDDCHLPEKLAEPARKFIRAADHWLAKNIKTEFRRELIELYFLVNTFIYVWENYSEHYRTLYNRQKNDLTISLYCLNPAQNLAERLSCSKNAAFFSATLSPFEYYRELFGCNPGTRYLSLGSPFPPQNLKIDKANIQTRFRLREKTLPQLCNIISSFIKKQTGNILIFFPSYRYLYQFYECLDPNEFEHKFLLQESGMSEPQREQFLDEFINNDQPAAGFAVLGGVFGEGIDLVGDRLSAAVIVGVGLPGICQKRQLIRNYYPDHEKGYNYAYTFPGITRVLQAAGRVIRSENDKGSILLIDDRFFTHKYRKLLPRWWQKV